MSQAGAVTLLRTAERSGLTAALSKALVPWRKPLATHDPGKVLLDLAVSVALGGDCLADIAVLREQPSVFGLVASDPTVSRLIAALAADTPKGRKKGGPLCRPPQFPGLRLLPQGRRRGRR